MATTGAPATTAGGPPRALFLRDYQARTLIHLLYGMWTYPGATFTVMYPRQAGKNELAAALVACLLRANAATGGAVVVCAPTFRPQVRISIERLRIALSLADRVFPAEGRTRVSGNTIAVGLAKAVFLSAAEGAHVAGHTASLGLIADEAQEIDADWFDRQFRPMAASTGAATVLFGTPWNGHTLLERAVATNRDHDAAHLTIPFHHEVGWADVAASRKAYGDYVRYERERLGANHPLYLSQYELIASDAAGGLLSPGQLALIEGAHPRQRAPRPGERYVAGLDLGGEGEGADATVLTIARAAAGRCEVVENAAWHSAPFETMRHEVTALARRWHIERLSIDATGLGVSLSSDLAAALGPRVEAVVFTSQSKSALGYALIAAIETGRLALYADDGSVEAATCRAELRDCRASLAGGRLSWGSPAAHDDYVVSLALCVKAAAGLGEPRLAVGRRRQE